MGFRKVNVNKVSVGDIVSAPIGYDFNGYMDYECAVIEKIWDSEKGYKVAKVRLWYHNSDLMALKNVRLDMCCKINYYHMVNEEELFLKRLTETGIKFNRN